MTFRNGRLNKDEFVPFAPTEVGAEVHVHHCKQGRDNDRLYIKRANDGTILAYCHHCGKSGSFNPARSRLSDFLTKREGPAKSSNTGSDILLPSDCISNFDHWPIEARRWVLQYGITKEEVTNVVHLYYSPYWGRVILPTLGPKGDVLRWQGRAIRGLVEKADASKSQRTEEQKGKRNSQKYHNKNSSGKSKMEVLQCSVIQRQSSSSLPDTLCIVEDVLSAIKVSRICDALPIQGSSAKIKDLTWVNKYGKIVIYLDNDNSQVKLSQTRLKNRLELLVPEVVVIHEDIDPKEQPTDKLEELIYGNRLRISPFPDKEG